MRISNGAMKGNRVDLTVIGYGVLTALVIVAIVAELVVAREKLTPHFESGGEEIVIPSDLV